MDEKSTVHPPTSVAPCPASSEEAGNVKKVPRTDGGYGWVCVFCLLGINAMTWGINTTYGVFTSYYLENNYYHASRMQYAWVGGLSVAVCDVMGPLANYMIKTRGFKTPMLIGAVLVNLGQTMAGICTSFAPFLVCQGLVFGAGLGLILVPSYPILAHWFDRRLALAQGIANAGSGIGGLILSNTTTLLLARLGVKWTLIINGCISSAVIIPGILLLRGKHKELGTKSAPLQISFLWHPGYRYVLLWAVVTMMQYFIAIYTLASYATDGLGLTQAQGGVIQSMFAAGQIIGRPLWGFLLDKGGRVNMVILSYLLCGIFTLGLWLPSDSFATLGAFAVMQGLVGGTIVSTSASLAASVVGVQDLGSALSIYWLAMAIPSLCSQPIAMVLVDYSVQALGRSGAAAYAISIGLTGSFSFVGALFLFGAKRYLQDGSWVLWKRV